jgi:hypothetical protein
LSTSVIPTQQDRRSREANELGENLSIR